MRHWHPANFFFLMGLNSGLHAGKAGALLLEPHLQSTFWFFEAESCYVAQAGLELSFYLSFLSVGIIGMNHCAWLGRGFSV
jgi:hypothetical protein